MACKRYFLIILNFFCLFFRLSGCSPFLGDDKTETFENITRVDYEFDEEYFGETSDYAKDFIGRFLVRDQRYTFENTVDQHWNKGGVF